MSKTLLFTPAAKADISNIWDYTLETWGEKQAISYVKSIQKACDELAKGQRISQRADIRSGYQKSRIGAHVAYFKVDDKALTIVRILHGRMDVSRHL